MRKGLLPRLLIRWLVSVLGLYIASAILGSSHLSVGGNWHTVITAGFVLALVNMILKPVLIFLSFPAIIISLGLFMLVVNGLVVLITSHLYAPLQVNGLGSAILAGIIIGLVNYLVSRILEDIK
jgi:putative membrane protein